MNNFNNQTIELNIDFDGTCVTHDYPRVGHDIGAVNVLKKLTDKGHRLILFTMRSDGSNFVNLYGTVDNHGLTDAINWFKDNDIPLYGIQTNPTQKSWTTSPKSYAPLMIDDSALGCPLKIDLSISPRPFVDWVKVEEMLIEKGLLENKS
jgi:hypothetical protein